MKKDIMLVRDSIGRVVSMLTLQKIKVTQRGAQAYVKYHPTNGSILEVNVPYLPDDASEEFIAAVQGFLDHEVGHVLFSDYAALQKAVKEGKRIANMANMVEDVFVERKMSETFQGSGVNLEATRKFYLEKVARPKIKEALKAGDVKQAQGYAMVAGFRAWGGQASAADFIKDPQIAALLAPIKDKLGPLLDDLSKCNNSMDCLDLARRIKSRLEEPEPKAPEPEPESGEGEPSEKSKGEKKGSPSKGKSSDGADSEEKSEPDDKGKTSAEEDDSGKTGAEPGKKLDADSDVAGEPKPESEADTEEGDDEPKGETEKTAPAGKDESDPDKATDAPEDTKGGDTESAEGDSPGESDTAGESDPDDENDSEGQPEGSSGSDAESGGKITPPEPKPTPDPLSDLMDDERDFDKDMSERLSKEATKEIGESDYAVFSTEWDKVADAPMSMNPKSVERLESSIKDKIGVMQKQLERAVSAQDRKMWNPGQRTGRIAPGNLFRVAAGDDRVFRKRVETRAKNTALSLVVDCSGSMSGSAIKLAGTAAFALSSVLDRLKITHEVIGFTTFTTTENGEMNKLMELDAKASGRGGYGRWSRTEALFMPVFKPFKGKLDTAARSRIAHLQESPSWLSNNVDGECVQMAARRLKMQKAERHIMIVLSDGEPCCYSGRGLNAHLKKVVSSIAKEGVEVIGIGIESNAVKSFYPKHITMNDAAELPERVMAELTKLLLAP